MAVNKIVLLTIVSTFIAYGHTAPGVLEDEFTVDHFAGNWFDIGRISSCNDITLHSCITHSIVAIDHDTYDFMIETIPYEKIPECDRGIPIHTSSAPGNFNTAKVIFDKSSFYPALNATIKSYNDGKELILTEARDESCSSTSYRLWSRERGVSAETIAEFEKLAGNGIVEYFSWDHCPIVRSEVHEVPVDLVLNGLWYDVATIGEEFISSTCSLSNVTVNHADNTFNIIYNLIRNGRSVVEAYGGYLSEFGTVSRYDLGDNGHLDSYEISCNEGEQWLTVGVDNHFLHLASRNPKVSAETQAEFRRFFDKVKEETHQNLVYTTYSYDDCPQ